MDGAELLTDLGRIADLCRAQSSSAARKKSGQFFTPAKIAKVMADKLRVVPGQDVRIIDPGAGVGILGIASAASMLERGAHSVHLTAVEPHGATTQLLKEALTLAESHLGPALSYKILEMDFLDFAQPTPGMPRLDPYHVAIANPPYFKMPPSNPRGGGRRISMRGSWRLRAGFLLTKGNFVSSSRGATRLVSISAGSARVSTRACRWNLSTCLTLGGRPSARSGCCKKTSSFTARSARSAILRCGFSHRRAWKTSKLPACSWCPRTEWSTHSTPTPGFTSPGHTRTSRLSIRLKLCLLALGQVALERASAARHQQHPCLFGDDREALTDGVACSQRGFNNR